MTWDIAVATPGEYAVRVYYTCPEADAGSTIQFDFRGSRIEGVPPSISSLLGSDGDSTGNRLQRRIISRGVLPLEREVRGLVSLDLEIE